MTNMFPTLTFPVVRVARCVHCRMMAAKHVDGACLFDSTQWTPMTEEQLIAYERGVWDEMGKAVAEDLKETLAAPSTLRQLFPGIPKEEPDK